MTIKIVVVGSINMDLVTSVKKVPIAGETVMGETFATMPGGKGANQAVAAARLGADVSMIGCLGSDYLGDGLLEVLKKEGIQMEAVKRVEGSSGTASIILSEGDNRIIVVPGANHEMTPEWIEENRKYIEESDLLLVQLEIPLNCVQKALEIAKAANVKTILNPAPITKLSAEIIGAADYITPNEHEYQTLLEDFSTADLSAKLIVTMGDEGVLFYKDGKEVRIPAQNVPVLDTTGAGDTFNGALGVALCEQMEIEEAIRFANKAAALSITKMGAQNGMPTKDMLEQFHD
ncbi:ribokinase [Pradoshia sp.]